MEMNVHYRLRHICVLCVVVLTSGCISHRPEEHVEQRETTVKAVTPPEAPPQDAAFGLCSVGLPTSGMWKCDPVFADVNHDGYIDLAALPRLGKGPSVWLGNGMGEWRLSSTGLRPRQTSCGGGLAFEDVNGDGNLDLAVADHCQGLFVYLGDGTGAWELVTDALYPVDSVGGEPKVMFTGAEDIALADVNDDGFLDILAGSSDEGGISLYHGDGTGRNWNWVSTGLPSTGWANRVMFFDVNGDGRPDVVASYDEGPRVWLNDLNGGWQAAADGLPAPMIRGLYSGLAVGDVNEDGLLDLAAANWVDGPEVYIRQSDGSWLKTPDVFPDMQGGAIGLAMDDIDGDGHLDIVVSGRLATDAGFTRGVFLLLGDGAGGWNYVPNSGLPSTGLAATSGIALADVDGDGVLDVTAASGLIVETAAGLQEPAIAARVLVWCSSKGTGDLGRGASP